MRALIGVMAIVCVACGGRTVGTDGNANGDGTTGANGGSGGSGGSGTSSSNACARGTPTFLAESAPQDARSVATDGTRVYWTTWGTSGSQDGGMIMSASVNGGASTTLIANEGTTTDIAVDATSVYWMNYGKNLRAMPKAGGAARTLFDTDEPMTFALDDSFAYVTTTSAVWKVALSGGAPQKLVDARVSEAIAVDDAYVYWVDRGAVGDNFTALSRVSKAGGAAQVLASGTGVFSETVMNALVVDNANVYWVATRADGVVATIPKTGGAPQTLVSGLVCPYTLRSNGDALFYANAVIACGPEKMPNRIFSSVPRAGGATTSIANAEPVGVDGAFAIDARNIYWTGRGQNGRGIYCAAL
jgi:hypothetical protein